VVMLAPLAFVFLFSFRIDRMSFAEAQVMFWASALMGVSLASAFLMFAGTSIAQIFLIAAMLFLTMSLWGYTTGRDLSKAGRAATVRWWPVSWTRTIAGSRSPISALPARVCP
jgi:FtsH-binding integral membrane protein